MCRKRAANQQARPSSGIEVVGVVTCNRATLLQSSLTSHVEASARYGRNTRFVVFDDSGDHQYAATSRDLLLSLSRHYRGDFGHVGHNEKTAYCALLSKMDCCPDDLLNFAILGDKNRGITSGANRNSLLLQTLGKLVLSVDDDTQCRVATIPGLDETVNEPLERHDQPPLESWSFAACEAAVAAAKFVDADLLPSHEAYLGRSLGGLVGSDHPEAGARIGSACAHMVESLYKGTGSVALTLNGLVGDSATYATG